MAQGILAGVRARARSAFRKRSPAAGPPEEVDLFQAVFEQAGAGMALVDGQGLTLQVNRRFVEILGHDPARLVGTPLRSLVHPDDVAEALLQRQRLENGEVSSLALEQRFRHQHGHHLWSSVTVALVRGLPGAARHFLVTLQDIQARKAAEAERHLFNEAFKQASQPLLLVDPSFRIRYFNPAFGAFLGYSLPELQGRHVDCLMPATETSSRAQDKALGVLLDRDTFSGEMLRVARDGSVVPTMVTVGPLFGDDGARNGWVASYVDLRPVHEREAIVRRLAFAVEQSPAFVSVTDGDGRIEYANPALVAASGRSREELIGAKSALPRGSASPLVEEDGRVLHWVEFGAPEAADALRERQSMFDTIAASLPGAVYYWDAELRCRYAGGSRLRPAGLSAEAMLGRRLDELMAPAQVAACEPALRLALAGGRPEPVAVAKPDGAHTLLTMVPDLRDGRGVGVTVVVSDVTALKQAELRLQEANEALATRARQAESAARAKSAFLANMSHEIRTPMNAVIGLTHLMRRECTDPGQAARLDKVADASEHLLSIINDVLDVSRIESGKLELEVVEFDLDVLLARCAGLFAETAKARGLALVEETGGLPRRLLGDPNRLSQALVNLLGNAFKFTQVGSVTLGGRVLETSGPDLLLRLEVRDTGIGLSPEQAGRLFRPFEQADASTTRRFGGSGLGLSITRHLAELMGGEAGVASEPDVGSTFWITARLKTAGRGAEAARPRGAQLPEAMLRSRHGGARVLLAEDNPVNQEVAAGLLEQAGLRVDIAENGEQAVSMARGGGYALILMDMQMPLLDGLAASRLIRREAGQHGVPIVAMTANAFGDDRAACLAAGMDDFVSKPVRPERLYDVLLRWLAAGPSPGHSNLH